MNNIETMYTEATNSFEQDLFTAFVYSGLVCTIDGSIANQLDVTAGVAFVLQSDSTLRRRANSASTTGLYTTSTPSTTYYLDLNPDGTFSWATSHSGVTNHLTICSATTNGSGNLLVVTDARPLASTFLSGMLGGLTITPRVTFPAGATVSYSNANALEISDGSHDVFNINTASKIAQLNNGTYLQGFTGDYGSEIWSIGRVAPGGMSLDVGKILSDGAGTVSGTGAASPGAPTLALAAGTALGIGVYDYKVTYTTSLAEGALGTLATITTTTGNQDVNLTAIPTGPSGVTGRNIYRTKVGGSTYYLLHSIADNTTTAYSDTTADGTLATIAPAHPSLGGDIWKNSGGSTVAQVFGDGAISIDAGNLTSDGAGNLTGTASASGLPMVRNGVAISAPLMSGSSFPGTAPVGTVFVKA